MSNVYFVKPEAINTNNNYSYTELGELKKDVQEDIEDIKWTVSGKIKEINRFSTSSKKNLKFEYDAMGNRVSKHIYSSGNLWEKSTYYLRDAQGNVMSTYTHDVDNNSMSFRQAEKHIFGSSRLGMDNTAVELISPLTFDTTLTLRVLRNKNYEIGSHLGSVLNVISDWKIPVEDGSNPGVVDYWISDVVTATDYSAFGVPLYGRTFDSEKFRYGYGNHEKIDEVYGSGNVVDMGDRWLDVRLGRTPKRDAKANKYPSLSPYSYAANNPIIYIDSDGKEIDLSNLTAEQLTKYNASIELLSSSKIFSYYYQQLVESETVYTIKGSGEVNGKQGGGYFDPNNNEVGVGESFNGYVVAQELFHAFQKDGGFYDDSNPKPLSTIETEGDIMTVYVMLESGSGFPIYGEWIDGIINQALESIPSSVEVGGEEYQKMFQQAVNDRIKYYEEQGLDAPTYTAPNTGEMPKALEAVIKGAEESSENNKDTEKK